MFDRSVDVNKTIDLSPGRERRTEDGTDQRTSDLESPWHALHGSGLPTPNLWADRRMYCSQTPMY